MVEEEALTIPVCSKPKPPLYVCLCPQGQTCIVVERLSVGAGVNEAANEDSPCWDYLRLESQVLMLIPRKVMTVASGVRSSSLVTTPRESQCSSSGWTGHCRKALLRSILARSVPRPSCCEILTYSWMETYWRVTGSGSM